MFIFNDLDSIVKKIELEAIQKLNSKKENLQKKINEQLQNNTDFLRITASHSPEFVQSIINNHIFFILETLKIKNTKGIIKNLTWEFTTYYNMGISFNFFKYILQYILKEIEKFNDETYNSFIELYEYIIIHYEDIILEAKEISSKENIPYDKDIYKDFMNALLEPNLSKAITISNDFIKTKEDISIFWEQVILSSLYNIGMKWSQGEISVGQEHTATSICERVMSEHYNEIIDKFDKKLRILISVSPNELHEVGARMIGDMLELNGYDIVYLGSSSSEKEIIDTIINQNIDVVLISTTIVANINKVKKLISKIRQNIIKKDIKIFVGGQAYSVDEELVKEVDADCFIGSSKTLLKVLKELESA